MPARIPFVTEEMVARRAQIELIEAYLQHAITPQAPEVIDVPASREADLFSSAMRLLESMAIEHGPLTMKDRERVIVIAALRSANFSQKDAAKALGMSPRVMNYKIEKLGIDWHRLKDGGEA